MNRIGFYLVFFSGIFVLAYLSQTYRFESDWSQGDQNTLSDTSLQLLSKISRPIIITVYATEDESIRNPIQDRIDLYRRYHQQINIVYINPEQEPQLVRERGVTVNGELIIEYNGRQENLKTFSEQSITNALQRLARNEQRWIVFLSGHGERSPEKQANHDFSNWAAELTKKGFTTQAINLAEVSVIPSNTAVLVIASPQVSLLNGEVKLINDYIKNGGKLIWFAEPGSLMGLEPLAHQLGITFIDGMIVDPTTKVFGINDPRFAIVTSYPQHVIVDKFELVTLYPQARGIRINEDLKNKNNWQTTPLMTSLARSWSEVGEMSAEIEFNKDIDQAGPLIVGMALERKLIASQGNATNQQQRVFVVGDGDFLSNAYLGNGGNMDLGISIMNWLSLDDDFIAIPAKTATDIQLVLSSTEQIIIAFGFLFILPLLLLGYGFYIWRQRRKL